MKRVLIRPSFADWEANRLFTQGTSYGGLYRDAFSLWKKNAYKNGFQIDTWDMAPLDEADVLWFLDLPSTRREFEKIIAQLKPSCSLVLQHLESPIFSWAPLMGENLRDFNLFLTYQHEPVTTKSRLTINYRLPHPLNKSSHNEPFEKRKGLVVLNSNIVDGLWAIRQKGIAGLPFFGSFLSGWSIDPSRMRSRISGELYSARRSLLREAENGKADFVDVFGPGWQGEKISWCGAYPNRPYRCARGLTNIPKPILLGHYRFALAYENFRGDFGYISEKILDCFCAGTVPVYLGDERIGEFIDPKAFVDARQFKTSRDLLTYLANCSDAEWQEMRSAGQAFLSSKQAECFSNEKFSQLMILALNNKVFYSET